jgi:hydrogenase expression/formation protein HypC
MCLGVPAKILSVRGDTAVIVLGGVQREISVVLLEEVSAEDWVIVHAGFAIERLSEEEAERTLAMFQEIRDENEAH